MKFLEVWGMRKVAYFFLFFRRHSRKVYGGVGELFGDWRLFLALGVAFAIGFVMTLPIVVYEIVVGYTADWESFIIYVVILVLSGFLEFYLLYLLGFATLGYYIRHLYAIDRGNHRLGGGQFRTSLVRIAMELPQKRITSYNVDPYEYKERRFLLLSLLYKAKVILTTVILKMVVRKLFGRSVLRAYGPLISAPVTAVWDAVVFWQTIRRVKYKLVMRFVARHMVERQMELLVSHTQTILYRYYYIGEYENNLSYLLQHIYTHNPFAYTKEEYLHPHTPTPPRLMALLLVFKATLLGVREKQIAKELGIVDEVARLRHLIHTADLDSLLRYVEEM